MRDYEEVEVNITKELTSSITCNKCGKTKDIKGNDPNNIYRQWECDNYKEFNLSFGYGSKFDMEHWNFDLCEKCLVDFVHTFKYLPDGFDSKYAKHIYDKL